MRGVSIIRYLYNEIRSKDFINKTNGEIHHSSFRFRCPKCVPATEEDDQCCSPYKCPERIPQPGFPSPNSSFPPDKLMEVVECIEEANQLLLALVAESDEVNLRSLQLSLKNLRGLCVEVIVKCNEKEEKLSGQFVDTGRDFIILEKSASIFLVPVERILSIDHLNEVCEFKLKEDQELIGINQCFRRELTFHFSQIVAKSPFLINLFFGLDLHVFLESFVGCLTYVYIDHADNLKKGSLMKIKERSIEIKVDDDKQGIDFDEICFIQFKR